jgi:hypothetical protein
MDTIMAPQETASRAYGKSYYIRAHIAQLGPRASSSPANSQTLRQSHFPTSDRLSLLQKHHHQQDVLDQDYRSIPRRCARHYVPQRPCSHQHPLSASPAPKRHTSYPRRRQRSHHHQHQLYTRHRQHQRQHHARHIHHDRPGTSSCSCCSCSCSCSCSPCSCSCSCSCPTTCCVHPCGRSASASRAASFGWGWRSFGRSDGWWWEPSYRRRDHGTRGTRGSAGPHGHGPQFVHAGSVRWRPRPLSIQSALLGFGDVFFVLSDMRVALGECVSVSIICNERQWKTFASVQLDLIISAIYFLHSYCLGRCWILQRPNRVSHQQFSKRVGRLREVLDTARSCGCGLGPSTDPGKRSTILRCHEPGCHTHWQTTWSKSLDGGNFSLPSPTSVLVVSIAKRTFGSIPSVVEVPLTRTHNQTRLSKRWS